MIRFALGESGYRLSSVKLQAPRLYSASVLDIQPLTALAVIRTGTANDSGHLKIRN